MNTIHEDKRGKISSIILDGKEYIIIETKKGYARGGDYHKSTQHDVVLRGKIFWEEQFDGVASASKELNEGDSTTVGIGIPHMYTSLTETIVLEWLEGDFEKEYFEPYRTRIMEIMENVEQKDA